MTAEPRPGRGHRPPSPSGSQGEFAAIERLRARLAAAQGKEPPGECWIGDDAAVLSPPTGRLLLTTDVTVAGVHADLSLLSVADLGWRAMVSSVSDVAAMGGTPRHAVVAIAGPPDSDLDELAVGLASAASEFSCPVVGGDLSAASQLTVAVAMTGEVSGPFGPVLRSGARPGDALLVTGPLGASAAGLRLLRDGRHRGPMGPVEQTLVSAHRRPRPRPAQGDAARRAGAHAMVDVSDGLAGDLWRLADASGVGFRLDHVPIAEGATLEEALGGGEDYELVIALSDPAPLTDAFARAGFLRPQQIGQCVADPAERTLRGRPLDPSGYEHRFVPDSGDRRGSGQGETESGQ